MDTKEALMILVEEQADQLVFTDDYGLDLVNHAIWNRKKDLQEEEMYETFLGLSRKKESSENKKAFIYEAYGWIYAQN